MPPCDVDARRCHELAAHNVLERWSLHAKQPRGRTYRAQSNTGHNSQRFKVQEGNHVINSMKLTLGDKLLAFTIDNANDSVYESLRKDEAHLAL